MYYRIKFHDNLWCRYYYYFCFPKEKSGVSKKLCTWSKITQVSLPSRDPMDCSLPGSSVHGILQARVLEWVAISFSKGSSWPRDRTLVSHIAGRRFTLWDTREAWKQNTRQSSKKIRCLTCALAIPHPQHSCSSHMPGMFLSWDIYSCSLYQNTFPKKPPGSPVLPC